MPCLSCRSPRKFLRHQFQRHWILVWPQQLRPLLLHLFYHQRLPPFWPSSQTPSSKYFRPSQSQAVLILVLPRAWPFSGGVSAPLANPSQLVAQASSFAASGVGFASSPLATTTPLASGRPNNFVVPTFVSTFSAPIPSLTLSASFSTVNAAFPSSAISATPLAPLPVLHQQFVVGPGFSPVPEKLVSQIVAGKFVELHELLPSNIVLTEPEPQLLFDGHLVLTSPPKKPERRIEDISTWLEAFCLLPYHRVILPSSLERSPAVSTPDTPHISPVLQSGLVVVQPSV